nr:immunoglobulin heavy chain junction region [Macaca mulatta]MOV35822.1 immunoglobulin heavy chain junction region [Macaca mulatta]MOV36216.1 immunoglobulin heavy chain junction region [Macaca mulatta]MOV36817.1 immunoglobulin heavy chain junction region [Macaca mulatta]MOY18369.1 immunoglobulin heavy chain junction region [Macaca mulatta]
CVRDAYGSGLDYW